MSLGGYRDFADCLECNKGMADPRGYCLEIRKAVAAADEIDERKRFRKVITKAEVPMSGGHWLDKVLRDERGGGRNSSVTDFRKMFEESPEHVTPEVQDDAIEAASAPLFPTALEQQRQQHPELPLVELAKRARIEAKAAAIQLEPWLALPVGVAAEKVTKAAGESASALRAFDRYVDGLLSAHVELMKRDVAEGRPKRPALSRPAAVSKALCDETGVQLYRVYQQANARLDRVRNAL